MGNWRSQKKGEISSFLSQVDYQYSVSLTILQHKKLRLIAKTASWVSTLESPFRIRQKISKLLTPKKPKLSSPDSVLKAINIGELNINEDGSTKEDPSWDGEDDPFYHLTPGERIEVLKTMSLQDIYEAALKRKTQNKKEKKRWTSREKQFKKPDL